MWSDCLARERTEVDIVDLDGSRRRFKKAKESEKQRGFAAVLASVSSGSRNRYVQRDDLPSCASTYADLLARIDAQRKFAENTLIIGPSQ